MSKKKLTKETEAPQSIAAFKAFDADMKCRGYQFAEGETYHQTGTITACQNGFHSCENPLDVLNYYDLCDSRFARVIATGTIARHDGDSKVASATLTIDAEIKLPEFIKTAVNYLMALCKDVPNSSQLAASGHSSKLAASGNSSKLAASGDSSKLAASGNSSQLAASGHYSQLAASGDYSKLAASGHYSQLAASGDYSKLAASGDYSQLAASGHSSKLAASGNSSQLAASGNSSQLAASGNSSIAVSSGSNSEAKVGKNGAIALSRWVASEDRYRISVAYEGENGIKADTWYQLDDNGAFVEVK